MTIRHLRIFVEVANSGKMSLAANRFFISQPTVSQAIAELEKHYDVLLFERISKRLYITDAGRTLLGYANKVIKEFEELEYSMMNTFHIQPIKIGATVTIGTCLISGMIKEFKLLYPDVDVNVVISNTRDIEQKLLNIELDIALVEGEITSLDLTKTPVIDDYLVVVCSTEHHLAKKKKVTIDDLKNERFIVREEGSGTRELFMNFMKLRKMPVKVGWVSNNSEAIKKAVIDNQGLSVMSIRLFEEELKDNLVKIIKVEGCSLSRKFSLVYHKNKFLSNQLNAIIDIIHAYKNPDIMKTLM